jgi:hypothetical protein
MGKVRIIVLSLGGAILLTLVALVDWGCRPADEIAMRLSPEMSAILKERRSTNLEVSTAGLPQLTPQESMERVQSLESAGTFEVFPLPRKSGSQDAFNYVIWRDLTTNQYWIVRDGGVAGTTVVFGPGKIEQK